MQTKNKKVWRLIAIVGTAIMVVAFAISIVQYFMYRRNQTNFIDEYVALFINTQLLACFIYMIFNPLDFRIYAFSFYIYAVGNLIDGGNLLAMFFLIGSNVFFYITNFFESKKNLKITILSIPLILALVFQSLMVSKINFLISVMHILAATFILIMLIALLYPEIKKLREFRETVYLSKSSCTEQEAEWLNGVLGGKLYSTIAEEANISESTVKNKMLRLYKLLNARNKTEFCAMYRSSHIELR